MSKKFTRLMAILLSLNLTFSTGTFAAFAAEAEDGSTDTGYSESGDHCSIRSESRGQRYRKHTGHEQPRSDRGHRRERRAVCTERAVCTGRVCTAEYI